MNEHDESKANDDEIENLNEGALDADQLTPDELEDASGGLLGSCVCDGGYCKSFSAL